MSFLKNKKAQSTAEYVIVLGLVIAAVIAMQTYVKRGLQGRIREISDTVDNAGANPGDSDGGRGVVNFTAGRQYEPYYLSSGFTTDRSANEQANMSIGGGVNRDLVDDEITTRRLGGYQRTGVPE